MEEELARAKARRERFFRRLGAIMYALTGVAAVAAAILV